MENAAEPDLDNREIAPLQILETRPDAIICHMIQDHELDELANISRPIVLGLATCFIGVSLGTLAPLVDVIDGVGKRPSTIGDTVTIAVFAMSVGLSLALSYFAYQGHMDALEKKRVIRSRSAITIHGQY